MPEPNVGFNVYEQLSQTAVNQHCVTTTTHADRVSNNMCAPVKPKQFTQINFSNPQYTLLMEMTKRVVVGHWFLLDDPSL